MILLTAILIAFIGASIEYSIDYLKGKKKRKNRLKNFGFVPPPKTENVRINQQSLEYRVAGRVSKDGNLIWEYVKGVFR